VEDEPRSEASVSGAGALRRSEPTHEVESTNGADPDLGTLVGLEAELADLDADLAQVDRSDGPVRAERDADAPVDRGGLAGV